MDMFCANAGHTHGQAHQRNAQAIRRRRFDGANHEKREHFRSDAMDSCICANAAKNILSCVPRAVAAESRGTFRG